MKKVMLINCLQPEETRIAILENGLLEELYIERNSNESYVGNIYKGKVVNIEPSIQAAFVDFGVGRNGFLHISDIDPSYFGAAGERLNRSDRGERGDRRDDRGGRREGPGRGERANRSERGGRDRPERGRPNDRRRQPEPSPAPIEEPAHPSFEDDIEREGEELAPPSLRDRPGDRSGDRSGDRPRREEGPRDGRRQRGGRRRRGGGGGGGGGRPRASESFGDDLPEELVAPNDSLPDLEDLKLEDFPSEDFGESEPPAAPPPPPARPEAPRARLEPEAPPRSPEPPPAAAEKEDSFGSGLLDEDPPAESQRGVYRRTGPPDEEDAFGGGLFDEPEMADLEAAEGAEEEEDEVAPDYLPAGDSRSAAIDNEEDLGPEPRIERYEDVEAIHPWSDEASEPALESVEEPMTADAEGGEETPKRRRRRRGGRRRRGKGGATPEDQQQEPPEVAETELAEPPAEAIEEPTEEEPEEDDFEEAPLPVEERPRGPRPSHGRNGDRRRPQRPMMRDPRRPRERPPIQDILKRGQEVIVQVIKEGIGNKGPTLSTYVSIPGRYLVLMPGLSRVGVSRKIVDEEQRRKLKDIVARLERPEGVGFIIRTAGLEKSQQELERDLKYLLRLWEVVSRRVKNLKAPCCTYQESDMITRTIRDIFTAEIDTIIIDEPSAFERAREFLQIVMPNYVNRLKLYDKHEPLFHNYQIEEEIQKIQQREVPLPRGGSIVIDQTEALVAIDVNSGNFRTDGSAEDTAYQINLAAAKEIARQLRLRDLGGVIVNDFIDMREERHRRSVENALRDAVMRDRAKTKILRMSAFGIIEMTRQRIRPSLRRSLYRECSVCRGTGQMKTVESVAIDCMRILSYVGHQGEVKRIQLTLQPEVALHLQNHKRKSLAEIESKFDLRVHILSRELRSPEEMYMICYGQNGEVLNIDTGIPRSEEEA